MNGLPMSELVDRYPEAAEAIIRGQQEYGYDCVYGRIGQNYEIEALGGKLRLREDSHPAVEKPYLVSGVDHIRKLNPERLRTNKALTAESEVIRMLCDRVGGRVPVMAYCQGPMRMAAQLVGTEPLLLALIDRPDFVHAALDFAVEVSVVKAAMATS